MPGFYTESFALPLKPTVHHSEIRNNVRIVSTLGAPATAIRNPNEILCKALKKASSDNYTLYIHYLKQRTTSFPVDTPRKRIEERRRGVLKELFIDPLKVKWSSDTLKTKSGYIIPKQKVTEPLGVASFILGLGTGVFFGVTWGVLSLTGVWIIFLLGLIGYLMAIISGYKINKYDQIYKGRIWPLIGGVISGVVFVIAIFAILLWNFSII